MEAFSLDILSWRSEIRKLCMLQHIYIEEFGVPGYTLHL